jgi:GT2 family glycosyltransferase
VISYLLPTRNRREALSKTLDALGDLSAHAHEQVGGAEVIVIDNASREPVELPAGLANGMALKVVRLDVNIGAAARNAGAAVAQGDWLVMLDDDSHPLDVNHVWVLAETEAEVAAIGASIHLPRRGREDGGLPEVIVGCGAAVRREPFLEVGGYDPAFGFYAEEYDLCAKLAMAGWRTVHDLRFRVLHGKVRDGRNMDVILRNLVRNNGWVMQRYAPRDALAESMKIVIERYEAIARYEKAMDGYGRGRRELDATIDEQPQTPMTQEQFDRFTGLAHVRETLSRHTMLTSASRVAVVDRGKNAWAVHQALRERDIDIVTNERKANALVIGTLSPGPMMDAWEHRRGGRGGSRQKVILPWKPRGLTAQQYVAVDN